MFLISACKETVPAASVIPAPIAYAKVVAIKKLPVGFQARALLENLAGNSSEWCL
jgi:hypothetical protein